MNLRPSLWGEIRFRYLRNSVIWIKGRFLSIDHGMNVGRAYVNLDSQKGLIEVSGQDARRFLNGLVTNMPSKDTEGVYSLFLNVKGRIVHDVFIYPALHNKKWRETNPQTDDEAFLVEHDLEQASGLLKYLKFRKLRDKVSIKQRPDWRVWYAWEDDPIKGPRTSTLVKPDPFIGATDPRIPGLGVRVVLSADAQNPLWALRVYEEERASLFHQVPPEVYDLRRLLIGLPEGNRDLPSGEIMPLEAGTDFTNAIEFTKGCYVGQELVTRAKRLGVVRRRVLPYQLYSPSSSAPIELSYDSSFELPSDLDLPHRSPVVSSDMAGSPKYNSRGEIAHSVARLVSRVRNIGFASAKVEVIDSPSSEGYRVLGPQPSKIEPPNSLGITFFRPPWLPTSDLPNEEV
ncbi:hypothetical protein V1511DRAFT_504129 [Dipodascopsis uninucleata]